MMTYSVQHFRDALTALVHHDQPPDDSPKRRLKPAPRPVEDRDLRLTRRELQVVLAPTDGLQDREIGRELGIAQNTVRSHLQRSALRVGLVA